MSKMTFILIFQLFFINPIFALKLSPDKELEFDPSKIEIISSEEALEKLGHYSYKDNDDVRYWSPEDVQRFIRLEIETECVPIDCINRKNIVLKRADDDDLREVINSYSWSEKSNRMISRLNLAFEEAKKRNDLGVFLVFDPLFDSDEVFFVQYQN